MNFRWVTLMVLLPTLAGANEAPFADVPPELQRWVPWVQHQDKELGCPFLYASESRQCVWPGRLTLTLSERGGHFVQTFKTFGRKTWLELPGANVRWPQRVQLNGRPVAVVSGDDDGPRIEVEAGEQTVSGDFEWDTLPEALPIPPSTALLALSVSGQVVRHPNRDTEGQLFLHQEETVEQETDRVEIDVHRLVQDQIPLQLTTQLTLKVSGRSRELVLGRVLPEHFVPMSITGELPMRVEADGHLRVQVRPGTWVIQLTARSQGPVSQLARPDPQGAWSEGDELWVFAAAPSLRQVVLEGPASVDPTQTTLPQEWRSYPAYAMGLKDTLSFVERRRGDSDPAPDVLNLARTLWLDFEGQGYTVSDQIHGQLHRSWRLDVQEGMELGRVVTSGTDQSITRLASTGKAGVELREGSLALNAESRVAGNVAEINAVSWDADFNSVDTRLRLPPGWRLLSARGADHTSGTWFGEWTLLDLFLVLVIAAAVAKLFGLPWGILAGLTLGLSWHESDLPRYVWLWVLVAEALVRVLPGRLAPVAKLARVALWAVLVVTTASFAVTHVRQGMYPAMGQDRALGGVKSAADYRQDTANQYASQWHARGGKQSDFEPPSESAAAPAPPLELEHLNSKVGRLSSALEIEDRPSQPKSAPQRVEQKDSKARVQTGPGLPRWAWNEAHLSFSGPVQRDQRLSLLLIGPRTNTALAFVRVALLGLLLLCVLGFPGGFWPRAWKRVQLAPGLLLMGFMMLAVPARAQSFQPSPELLEQLRQRVQEKPECAPNCASNPRLHLEATATLLRLRLEVLTAADTAIPLPGNAKQWVPESVLLDGKAASGLWRDGEGTLWLALPRGTHQVLMEGVLPQRDEVMLALPLRARRVEAQLHGWALSGVHEDGVADDDLQLSRQATAEQGTGSSLQTGTLPAFVQVERTLNLGLQWTVDTTVTRLTPVGSAVVLEVPLLNGESVTSSDVRVQGRNAQVNLGAASTQLTWSSTLEPKAPIELVAPGSGPFVEVWRLNVSPVWHATFNGIAVVHQQDASGLRAPEWRPWPGERVTIDVQRPESLAGQTMTVDESSLMVAPGSRATDATFSANFRSSKGGMQTFVMPEGATLQTVQINGVQQPIRQEGQKVMIPLVPGAQSVQLDWRQPGGLGSRWQTPSLDVGTPTVNAVVQVRVPEDRWLLWVTGPGAGPAVLFWSFLLVLVAVSIGLARTGLTPLSTVSWVLLAIGVSQVPIPALAVVFAWLLLLGWRQQKVELSRGWFNLRQLALVGVTVAALTILIITVSEGLLGQPQMQVQGNGSNGSMLRWFVDRTGADYPTAWVISVPKLAYRGLMLAWSVWMALSLVSWLKWGWKCFALGGLWRPKPPKAVVPAP